MDSSEQAMIHVTQVTKWIGSLQWNGTIPNPINEFLGGI